MSKVSAKELFRKYLSGKATRHEAEAVFEYLSKTEYEEVFQEVMNEIEWDPQNEIPLVRSEDFDLTFQKIKKSTKQKPRIYYPTIIKLTAVFIGVMLSAIFVFYQIDHSDYLYKYAPFSETKTVKLPDGTNVTLNANSKLKYFAHLKKQGNREVWLDGEAYFCVKKSDKKFIVHTDKLDVQVLGTRFNVNNRHHRTSVVLEKGSVKLDINGIDKGLYMKPGDMVEYSNSKKKYTQKRVNTKEYTSWKNNLLMYDYTPLWEIAQQMQDLHGLKIEFKNETIKYNLFTGKYPMDQPYLVIKAIAKAFDLKTVEKKDYIMFK